MSDVWPPPPENQPQIVVPAPSLRRSLAAIISSGLLYSCLGAVLLVASLLVVAGRNFFHLHFFPDADLSFGELALLGAILVIVGGYLGYATKSTANGFAALAVSAAAFAVSAAALTVLGCLACLVLKGLI